MKAIDELKEILADEEEQSLEYGTKTPINTEITIESELVYRLIKEWPSDARSEALNDLRKRALGAMSDIYRYLQEEA